MTVSWQQTKLQLRLHPMAPCPVQGRTHQVRFKTFFQLSRLGTNSSICFRSVRWQLKLSSVWGLLITQWFEEPEQEVIFELKSHHEFLFLCFVLSFILSSILSFCLKRDLLEKLRRETPILVMGGGFEREKNPYLLPSWQERERERPDTPGCQFWMSCTLQKKGSLLRVQALVHPLQTFSFLCHLLLRDDIKQIGRMQGQSLEFLSNAESLLISAGHCISN